MIDKFYIFGVIIVYLQLCFLPGFLISYQLRINSNFINLFLISFTSSFVINNLIIFLLTLLNIYNLIILTFIFFFELFFIFLKWKSIKFYFLSSFILLKDQLQTFLKGSNIILKNISLFILIYIIFLLITIFYDKDQKFAQIFFHGDAIEWYLKWSREYYNNTVPKTAFLRPQMWSSNISMFFLVLNTTQIEMFGKIIFNFIPLFMLFAITSISISKNNLTYFISGCLGIIFSLKMTFGQATSGYMEIPLSFSFLIIMVFFFELRKKEFKDLQRNFVILSIFLFMIQTKELGWIGLILLLYLFYDKEFNFNFKNFRFLFLIGLIVFLPFYVYQFFQYNILADNDVFKLLFFDKEFHISAGHDLKFLDLKGRIILAAKKFPIYILLPTLLCFIPKKKDKIFILFTYFIVIYTCLWFLIFSNEIRYLYPIILIVCLIGYGNLFNLIYSRYEKNFKK